MAHSQHNRVKSCGVSNWTMERLVHQINHRLLWWWWFWLWRERGCGQKMRKLWIGLVGSWWKRRPSSRVHSYRCTRCTAASTSLGMEWRKALSVLETTRKQWFPVDPRGSENVTKCAHPCRTLTVHSCSIFCMQKYWQCSSNWTTVLPRSEATTRRQQSPVQWLQFYWRVGGK